MAHHRLQAEMSVSAKQSLNYSCFCHVINILLTELSQSVWENPDLGRVYRPNTVRSVLTTLVKIRGGLIHRSQVAGQGSQVRGHRSGVTGHGSQVTGRTSQITNIIIILCSARGKHKTCLLFKDRFSHIHLFSSNKQFLSFNSFVLHLKV